MGLFSFLTENGKGCLAVLAKDKLIYEVRIYITFSYLIFGIPSSILHLFLACMSSSLSILHHFWLLFISFEKLRAG